MQSKEKNTETKLKILRLALVALLICGILPIVWIAQYNVIGLDDYSNGVLSHQTWNETRSIWRFIKAAFVATKDDYLTWQGSFTYNFLCHVYPAYIDEKLAWLTPIVMVSSLVLSLRYLYSCLIERFSSNKTIYTDVIFLILAFGIIQEMPSAIEAYFWYCGAVGYTFLHTFYFYLAGALICVGNEKNENIMRGVLICIGAFLLGGSHYITALECAVLFVLYFGISLISREKICWWKWVAMLLFFVGFAIQIVAPGNGVRHEAASGMSAFVAICNSFIYAFKFGYHWLSPMKILIILLLTPWMWKLLDYSKIQFKIRKGVFVFFISFCVYASCFTAPLYGVGNVQAGRIQNLIYIMLYVIFFIDYYYLLGVMKNKLTLIKIRSHFIIYPLMYSIIVIFGLFIVLLGAVGNKDKYVATSAIGSLISGEAKTYYEESMERYQLLNDESIREVILQPYSVRPHVLFSGDVVEEGNEDFWVNHAVQRYYAKDKVVLDVE